MGRWLVCVLPEQEEDVSILRTRSVELLRVAASEDSRGWGVSAAGACIGESAVVAGLPQAQWAVQQPSSSQTGL